MSTISLRWIIGILFFLLPRLGLAQFDSCKVKEKSKHADLVDAAGKLAKVVINGQNNPCEPPTFDLDGTSLINVSNRTQFIVERSPYLLSLRNQRSAEKNGKLTDERNKQDSEEFRRYCINAPEPYAGSALEAAAESFKEDKDYSKCLESIRVYIRERADEAEFKAVERHREIILSHVINEVDGHFANCRWVTLRAEQYMNISEYSTYKAWLSACIRFPPLKGLTAVKYMATESILSSHLFTKLAKATGYSDELFTTIGTVILKKAQICGYHAEECRKLQYPYESIPAFNQEMQKIDDSLGQLDNRYELAHEDLLSKFRVKVVEEVKQIAHNVSRFPTQIMAIKIYRHLNHTYPSRSWVVLVFDHPASNSPHKIYERDNEHRENSFTIPYNHFTIIFEYANRTNNCTNMSKKFEKNRLLKDFFHNDLAKYERITQHKGPLSPLLGQVKEQLQTEVDYMIQYNSTLTAVKYTTSFAIETDFRYHFYDCIRNHRTGQLKYCILLGWC